MSLPRLGLVSVLFALGCGAPETTANEPQTAREKQLAEAKASGELDDGNAKWGKWRYTGDRNACFFVVGKKCFKTEKAACSAAKCRAGTCETSGAGPASVSCAAGEAKKKK